MSGGLFTVARSIWDHAVFAEEPFTEREAWLWLVSEAAWRPRRIRQGSGFIELKRGQLSHSQRFLASKWRWSRGKVARFLKLLENETMIEPATDHQQTILTICNYERFQDFDRYREPPSEPAVEPPTDQQKATNRAKEEHQITPDNQIDDDDAREKLDQLEDALRTAAGEALNPTQPGLSVLSVPLSWLEQGADLERDVLPTIRDICARASPGTINAWKYFTNPVAQAKANRTTPLPEATHDPRPATPNANSAHLAGLHAAAQEAR